MAKVSADSGPIYGLGIIGAAIYYISTATSFWMGVLGFLKALVWPGFLVYELLKWLGAQSEVGTVINVAAILLCSLLGVLLGHRLPEKMSRTLTDAMGLVVLVIGALNLGELANSEFASATKPFPSILVVLASLLIGGVIGSLLQIEQRLEDFGSWLQQRSSASGDREKFIQGFVNASLLFTIGPMAVLGSLQDGLGQGFEILGLKSTLDGFTSVAFSATMGWGVAFSAIPVGIWQGTLTLIAMAAGSVLSTALVASITATGGILLLGTGLRLMNIRMVAVADLLPALVIAPVLTLLLSL